MRELYEGSSRGDRMAMYLDGIVNNGLQDEMAVHPHVSMGVARIGRRCLTWDEAGNLEQARYADEDTAILFFHILDPMDDDENWCYEDECDECHYPEHEPGGLLDELKQAERLIA